MGGRQRGERESECLSICTFRAGRGGTWTGGSAGPGPRRSPQSARSYCPFSQPGKAPRPTDVSVLPP